MAYYNEDQIYRYFDKAILNESRKRILELEKEIADIYNKEMKRTKEALIIKKELRSNSILRELRVEYQDQINKIGIGYDAKLIKERQTMTTSVFDSVMKKIDGFVKSLEYKKLMKEKLRKLCQYLDGEKVIIRIALHDKMLAAVIKESVTSPYVIEKTNEIKLGGFGAIIKGNNTEIDETIDSKISERKKWFLKNSKLFIKS